MRKKAVDIANALLRDDYEEGRSITIATSQAEEWNDNHQEPIHVVPHEDRWAIKEEGHDEAQK
ncbi:UNVERIFIED_CONTAM: uncharacterized protein YdaT [Paenibacillus sp. PvR008]